MTSAELAIASVVHLRYISGHQIGAAQMTEMYDPNNPAHVGPQVTARPGTKRHLAQTRARAVFFAIRYAAARGDSRRAEAALATHLTKMLDILPPAGNA